VLYGDVVLIPRKLVLTCITIIVFSPDSPATWSRSIGSGGESSSMLRSVEGNAVQAFSKGNNFLPH
jgi:hypothetical protein